MIGRVLANRYEILEKVGSGGMANVYKARDRMLNRYVAIKVLHSEYKEDEEFIRRFNIESQAAASLSHQNIVQIYDVGDEDGIQYIVMEYLSGMTLKEYIKSKPGGLYWKEAADYSMQICRALECAHQKHIVHRDIKPQNIMVTTEGILKVTDFGIARAANNNTTKMNSTAIGSAHYLSPEQARGGYTDNRSDIYSLGVVMYELFTGELPFDAETPVAVAMKHIQEEPVPPRKLNSSIPVGIEQIILKAMSKEVRLRYNNVGEMLSDLKLLYIDPEATISVNNSENGETRIINTNEVKRRVSETKPSVNSRRRQESAPQPAPRRKKKKSASSVVAVMAAAAAILVLIAVGIIVHVLSRNSAPEIPVPNILGMTVEEAQKKLDSLEGDYAGFTVKIDVYENNSAEKDLILSQTPKEGDIVKGSQVIKVVVSSGPAEIVMGSYKGETFTKIERELTKKGIEVIKEEESSNSYPSGTIIDQAPDSGTVLRGGDTVTLYVSTGSENKVVPSVVGLSEADARTAIERSGLNVGETVHKANDEYVKGLVYDQSYTAYTEVPEGTNVDIFVSDGPKSGDQQSEEPSVPEPKPVIEQPKIVDNPSEIDAMKTRYLSLTLPTDRTKVTVKLVCDGKVIYEKEHNTASGTADISLKSKGTINVDIYYDDELVATREVKFN